MFLKLHIDCVKLIRTKNLHDKNEIEMLMIFSKFYILKRRFQSDKLQYENEFQFNFIGDRDRYSVPDDLSTIHAEFTYFYFPGDFDFPCKYE